MRIKYTLPNQAPPEDQEEPEADETPQEPPPFGTCEVLELVTELVCAALFSCSDVGGVGRGLPKRDCEAKAGC